jgi:flagellar biosynthesis regulator FlbT
MDKKPVEVFVDERLEKIIMDKFPEILNFTTLDTLKDCVIDFYEMKLVFKDKQSTEELTHWLDDMYFQVQVFVFKPKHISDLQERYQEKMNNLTQTIAEELKAISSKQYPNSNNI